MASEALKAILKSFPNRKIGRPSKLDPVMMDRICRLLAEGRTFNSVARLVGINPDTFHTWRATNATFYAMTEAARNRARKLGLVKWEHGYQNLL